MHNSMNRGKRNFPGCGFVFLLLFFPVSSNAAITDPGNGNPLVPGFFADPFVFYDNGRIREMARQQWLSILCRGKRSRCSGTGPAVLFYGTAETASAVVSAEAFIA